MRKPAVWWRPTRSVRVCSSGEATRAHEAVNDEAAPDACNAPTCMHACTSSASSREPGAEAAAFSAAPAVAQQRLPAPRRPKKKNKCDACSRRGRPCGAACDDWPGHADAVAVPPALWATARLCLRQSTQRTPLRPRPRSPTAGSRCQSQRRWCHQRLSPPLVLLQQSFVLQMPQ